MSRSRRVGPAGRLGHGAQRVLPRRARRAGEHRRRDRRQRPEVLRGQRLGAEDQIGVGGLDRVQVGRAAGAGGRDVVNDGAQIGRLAVRSVGQRRGDDARLQTQRAQGVELVSGQHHDALRVGVDLGAARGVPDLAPLGPLVERRGVGRARLVGSALVAKHAGARDLGGAGDGCVCGAGRGTALVAPGASATAGDGDRDGRGDRSRRGDQTRREFGITARRRR